MKRMLVALLGLTVVLGACSASVFDETPTSEPAGPSDPPIPPIPPPDPNADVDGDGFTQGAGDCHDGDSFINPGAVEVEGMRCGTNDECPSGVCAGNYCRCQVAGDCSSNKPCAQQRDCTFSGEVCKDGHCLSTFACMQPQPGIPNPGQLMCRDNRDNDCDGQVDELPGTCDPAGQLGQNNPFDYAKAMDICDEGMVCDAGHPCPGKLVCRQGRCSRVLNATFNASADPQARAIVDRFAQGGPFAPKAGTSLVVLSTGKAIYNPQIDCPQTGTAFTNEHTDPDVGAADPEAFDYIELALEIAVPTNAQSLDFNFHFFSSEYPEWLTSKFNDTFWVQLQSKSFTGNISFDKQGTPIRIKSAFFDICDPDPANPQTTGMCTQPASLLTGTGYAQDCDKEYSTKANGGSTGWLHTSAPVTPGETIKLVFAIFDKGDHKWDSAVLIDNFRWKLAPAANPFTGTIE
jgi:hypothetical protein